MKKLLAGLKIKDAVEAGGSGGFCEFSAFVKKGHEECGDSAFIYCDGGKFAAGVFDGVSGEAGAASASSDAAAAALDYLAKAEKADEKTLREAVVHANDAVKSGFTTAALALVMKDGSFVVAGVGDSPVYSMSKNGEIDTELPLGRAVGDNDSVLKFLNFRNLVTSALGRLEADMDLHMRSGKLEKGELLILASDGLSDNLSFTVAEGYVSDTAGTADLGKLLGKTRKPETIVKILAKAVAARLAKGQKAGGGRMLAPKQDDVAMVAFRFG